MRSAVVGILLFVTVTSGVAGYVTDAYWDNDHVEIGQGSNVTLTCNVVGTSVSDVIRVVHNRGARTVLLADNDVIASGFSETGRFASEFVYHDRTSRLKLHVRDVRVADTGTIACQKEGDDEYIGYLDLVVIAPVETLYMTSINSKGEEQRVDDGGDVYLQQFDSTGVGCVAALNGTLPAPILRVRVGQRDVTAMFNVTTSSVLLAAESDDSAVQEYRIEVRAAFVTDDPDVALNGHVMTCTASRTGFDDVSTTAYLNVQYAPIISCENKSLSIEYGQNVTFTCSVKGNPGCRVTWSAEIAPNEDYDVNSDDSVHFLSTAVKEDEAIVSLHINNVAARHNRSFSLRADNVVGSSWTTIHVVAVLPVETPTVHHDDHGLQGDEAVDFVGVLNNGQTTVATTVATTQSERPPRVPTTVTPTTTVAPSTRRKSSKSTTTRVVTAAILSTTRPNPVVRQEPSSATTSKPPPTTTTTTVTSSTSGPDVAVAVHGDVVTPRYVEVARDVRASATRVSCPIATSFIVVTLVATYFLSVPRTIFCLRGSSR